MCNHPYDIERYEAILKSQLTRLTIYAVLFLIMFVILLVQSISLIDSNSKKKRPYIELLSIIIPFAIIVSLIGFPLGSQIVSCKKDISEQAYIQYEGPVVINTEKMVSHDGIHSKTYIISFDQNGERVELPYGKKRPTSDTNVYLVYSKHAKSIIEIEFLE